MKKINKRLVFLSVIMIIVTLSLVKLYSTYATGESQDPDVTFNFTLTGDTIVTVGPLSSKTIFYQIKNTNQDTVKYGVAYSNVDGITVRVWEGYSAEDLIDENETVTVKLKISNTSNTQKQVELSTILGYETGGNLIVPANTTLVSDNRMIYNTNTLTNTGAANAATGTFLGTTIIKNTIESITFVNDNIVPADALGSFNMCSNTGRADAIKLWYTDTDNNNLYEVYIGSDNGVVSLPSDSKNYFMNLTNVVSIDFSAYIDTSNATLMSNMFAYCSSLTSLNLNNFDTSHVTTMAYMFRGCNQLSSLKIENFNTSNVENMEHMFYVCSALEELNISNFNTRKVTIMFRMFSGCSSLRKINLSNFETPLLSSIERMFEGCTSIREIDLSNVTISGVTSTVNLFENCQSLTKLNISKFNFSNVTNYSGTFTRVPSNAEIIVSDCSDFTSKFSGFTNVHLINGTSCTV